jgi:hypothetical protein
MPSPAPDVDITLIEDHTESANSGQNKREFRLQFETTVGLPEDSVPEFRGLLQSLRDNPGQPNARVAIFDFVVRTAPDAVPDGSRALAMVRAALGL